MRWTQAEYEKTRVVKPNTFIRKYNPRSHGMEQTSVHYDFPFSSIAGGVPFSYPARHYLLMNPESSATYNPLASTRIVLDLPVLNCSQLHQLLIYPLTSSTPSTAPNPQASPSDDRSGSSPPTVVAHPPTPVVSSTPCTGGVTVPGNAESSTSNTLAARAVQVVPQQHGPRVLRGHARTSVPQRKAQREGYRS